MFHNFRGCKKWNNAEISEIIDRYHKTMEKFKYPRWLQYKSDNGQLRTYSHQSVLYQREKSLKKIL